MYLRVSIWFIANAHACSASNPMLTFHIWHSFLGASNAGDVVFGKSERLYSPGQVPVLSKLSTFPHDRTTIFKSFLSLGEMLASAVKKMAIDIIACLQICKCEKCTQLFRY